MNDPIKDAAANELFAELDQHFVQEVRQPGDIDRMMIANRYHVAPATANLRMREIATQDPGHWTLLKIRDPGDGHSKFVLRPVRSEG